MGGPNWPAPHTFATAPRGHGATGAATTSAKCGCARRSKTPAAAGTPPARPGSTRPSTPAACPNSAITTRTAVIFARRRKPQPGRPGDGLRRGQVHGGPLTLVSEVHYFGQTKQKPAWQGILIPYGAVGTPAVATAAPTTPPTSTTDDLFDFDSIEDIRNSAGDRWSRARIQRPLERIEVTFRASLKWHRYGRPGRRGRPLPDRLHRQLGRLRRPWNETRYVVTQTDPDNSDNDTTDLSRRHADAHGHRRPLVKEPYFHRLVTLHLPVRSGHVVHAASRHGAACQETPRPRRSQRGKQVPLDELPQGPRSGHRRAWASPRRRGRARRQRRPTCPSPGLTAQLPAA